MPPRALKARDHIVLVTPPRCHCGGKPARWALCPTCRVIVSRCANHEDEVPEARVNHCSSFNP